VGVTCSDMQIVVEPVAPNLAVTTEVVAVDHAQALAEEAEVVVDAVAVVAGDVNRGIYERF
jgi:hypothetical protein